MNFSKHWIASASLTTLLIALPPLSSSGALGQYLTRSEFAPLRIAPPDKFRAGAPKRPEAVALQPAPVRPPPPTVTGPVTIPAAEADTPFGRALAACDKLADGFEAPPLPAAKGEVKLDRCYRGRDHFVCTFGVLLTEANALLQDYKRITDANYPEVGNFDDLCRIKPETLASDVQAASDFSARFRALRAQNDARVSCGTSVEQSVRQMTLSDMAQAPNLLKSMIDAIEGDMKGVSGVEPQVAALAGSIDASQKAMSTIQKIHRAMCAKDRVVVDVAPQKRVGP